MRVKFRDNEELQDLNAHTQSGGERAVSTAIYMLALQELTPAPFRLVDEINQVFTDPLMLNVQFLSTALNICLLHFQGMDSKNERKVYELLLQSTGHPGTPQYFLLTPKVCQFDLIEDLNSEIYCVPIYCLFSAFKRHEV